MNKGYIVFLIFFICSLNHLIAQEQKKIQKTGIELGTGLSYTGFHLNLAATLYMGANEYYLGPKLVISDAYLPQKGPWGINAGYRRIIISKEKLKSFINFDYQLGLAKPYNPNQLEVNGLNQIHEFHLCYGFGFRLAKQIWLGNTIGIGAYLENNIDVVEDMRNAYSGYSGYLNFFVQYKF